MARALVHQHLNIIQIPFTENVLLVTTEPNVPIGVPKKIFEIIQKHIEKSQKDMR